MSSARRLLYLVHRWMGVVLCAFFAMWFVSGVVMMYVGYPKLTAQERLAHLPALDGGADYLSPARALAAAGLAGRELDDLRLAMASRGQAVYLATPAPARGGAGQGARRPRAAAPVVIDARDGSVLRVADREAALASARAFAGSGADPGAAAPDYEGTIDEDAFTHSRALDAHRPLHVVQLHDAARTRLYVSGTTGEVVRDAPRAERLWNYAGAWIHWLYPFRGNVFDRWWTDIVNWLSIAGIVLTVTGTVVGVMRWRFTRRYRSASRSPYTGRAMRWHHIAGLAFAGITFSWIFSGLMSMNPWRVLDSGAPALRTEAMNGGRLAADALGTPPRALLAAAGGDVRELRWLRAPGRDLVAVSGPLGRVAVLDAGTARAHVPDATALRQAAARLVDAPVHEAQSLAAYDLYYYARDAHTMTGGNDKPLPVLRMKFADAHATWVHLDPATGEVLGRTDDWRRAGRWLFAMLHSWDWLPLLQRRPLWDIVLIALSAGGLLLSATGVVIGLRRLVRKGGALARSPAGVTCNAGAARTRGQAP
ncbi:MAG: PepSY domain-containing protein [Burkholderiales bacterium]|nr:PepSY domain-containing protein [Burkholderiales bacterium]